MDLSKLALPDDLELTPIVTCTVEGILEAQDIAFLLGETEAVKALPAAPEEEPENPADLKKIREKHHSVARLLASGMTQRMVAQLSGYTESYLSILINNPSMQSLIEMYRVQHGAASAVITEKLKTLGLKAAEALDEKIDAKELSNQELLAAAKLGLDRGGHGPQSKHTVQSETHLIDHARLRELNAAALRGSSEYIVPVSAVRAAVLPAPNKENDDV